MIVDLDIWKALGLAATLIAAFWTLVALMVKQFNAGLTTRFAALESSRSEADARDNERFNRLEADQKTSERELLLLKAELPERYVRREDAIRSEMTLHAKFDGLASRIDMFMRATQ